MIRSLPRLCEKSKIAKNGPSKIIRRDRKTFYRSNTSQDFFAELFHLSFRTASTAGGFGPVSLSFAVCLWRNTVVRRDEASLGRTFTQRESNTSKLRERS